MNFFSTGLYLSVKKGKRGDYKDASNLLTFANQHYYLTLEKLKSKTDEDSLFFLKNREKDESDELEDQIVNSDSFFSVCNLTSGNSIWFKKKLNCFELYLDLSIGVALDSNGKLKAIFFFLKFILIFPTEIKGKSSERILWKPILKKEGM